MPESEPDVASLELGFKVVQGKIAHWSAKSATPGCHTRGDLFAPTADLLTHHGLVLARSGSGKSYLVGRLIEELTAQTDANCLIVDPNSDFTRMDIPDRRTYEDAHFGMSYSPMILPTETDLDQYWDSYGGRLESLHIIESGSQHLALGLLEINPVTLYERVTLEQHGALDLCAHIMRLIIPLVTKAHAAADIHPAKVLQLIQETYDALQSPDHEYLLKALPSLTRGLQEFITSSSNRGDPELTVKAQALMQTREDLATTSGDIHALAKCIDPSVFQSYLSRLRQLVADGLATTEPPLSIPSARLSVINLPRIPNQYRAATIDVTLRRHYETAKKAWELTMNKGEAEEDCRSPLFIIVDEAHNVMPADPVSSVSIDALRTVFRTIAAEGRKYGVFLIAISQRPDKIDPTILSECENILVMRLASVSLLDNYMSGFGWGSAAETALIREKVSTLGPGYAIATGPWAEKYSGHVEFFCGARRTQSGGRNLSNNWCVHA